MAERRVGYIPPVEEEPKRPYDEEVEVEDVEEEEEFERMARWDKVDIETQYQAGLYCYELVEDISQEIDKCISDFVPDEVLDSIVQYDWWTDFQKDLYARMIDIMKVDPKAQQWVSGYKRMEETGDSSYMDKTYPKGKKQELKPILELIKEAKGKDKIRKGFYTLSADLGQKLNTIVSMIGKGVTAEMYEKALALPAELFKRLCKIIESH